MKFYTKITTGTEILTSWNPLKSCRVPLNGRRRKLSAAGHRAVEGVSQLRQKKLSIAEFHRLQSQIPFPKTTRSLSLNHSRKEGIPSSIQATRIELCCMKQTVFVLTSELLVCLLCLNEFSSHDIVLHTINVCSAT